MNDLDFCKFIRYVGMLDIQKKKHNSYASFFV